MTKLRPKKDMRTNIYNVADFYNVGDKFELKKGRELIEHRNGVVIESSSQIMVQNVDYVFNKGISLIQCLKVKYSDEHIADVRMHIEPSKTVKGHVNLITLKSIN